MKQNISKLVVTILLALAATSMPARADCYVAYKAKQKSDALKLHYGVIQLDDLGCADAERADAVSARLAAHGWTLLRVTGVVPPSELLTKQEDAGDFFLRY